MTDAIEAWTSGPGTGAEPTTWATETGEVQGYQLDNPAAAADLEAWALASGMVANVERTASPDGEHLRIVITTNNYHRIEANAGDRVVATGSTAVPFQRITPDQFPAPALAAPPPAPTPPAVVTKPLSQAKPAGAGDPQ